MAFAIDPVTRYGRLKVVGRHLFDQNNCAVQLRGISSHGLQWYADFVNHASLVHLRDHWHIDVIRLAMYLDEDGYIGNKQLQGTVEKCIQIAIDVGLYVVVDWHVHEHKNFSRSGDPRKYEIEAIIFFTEIAKKFGSYSNIIYEIANEPRGVSWEEIRDYASRVIPAIRLFDKNNLIVVGTPQWSQEVQVAEQNRLSYDNIVYALHFYAGSHELLLDRAQDVVAKDLPLFVTEWGTTESSGHGGVHAEATHKWMSFLRREKISWINWSLCDKPEDSAILKEGATTSGPWSEKHLTASGLLLKYLLSREI